MKHVRNTTRDQGRNNPWLNNVCLAILLALPFLLLTGFFLRSGYNVGTPVTFVIDDAWIHLELAKNIAEGNGFSFNPHEPIAASTAPLYTIIIAILYFFFPNYIGAMIYILTSLLTICTIWLSYALTKQLTKNEFFSLATALAISSNPWIVWSALSGMEITLGMFLLMLAVWTYSISDDRKGWKTLIPAVLFALTTLVRPESYSILGVYFLVELGRAFFQYRTKEVTGKLILKRIILRGVAVLIVILPYGIFSLVSAGSFFPNTYAAKVGDLGLSGIFSKSPSLITLVKSLYVMGNVYFQQYFSTLMAINPWIRWTYVVMTAVYVYEAYKNKKAKLLLLPAICLIFPVMVGIVVPADRVSWPWYRHMLYLVPLLTMTSFVATFLLFLRLKQFPIIRMTLVVLLLAVTAQSLHKTIPEVRRIFLEQTLGMKRNHLALANWVKNNIPPDAVIAASDIGVIGYYTENYIVDTEGLINPHISTFTQRRNSNLKDAEILAYLTEQKPDYLVKFYWVYPTLASEDFSMIRNFGTMGVYSTPWTRFERPF